MAEISAKLVKELRDQTGAGMLDCKKALQETEGDVAKAKEWLRQKGITSAEKKAGKVAAEGLIGSYIHTGGRVGVLVEVNCQTDFVARNQAFKELVQNIAMQIAANPNVEYVRVEDIPSEFADKEKEIEMGREDLASKPVNIREKIVVGRIEKRLKEITLMDQPYIRDQSISVEEMVKQNVAQLGENIQVRRFARFVMGEGIEKEEVSFADEVAAQTATQQEVVEELFNDKELGREEVASEVTENQVSESEAIPENEVAEVVPESEAIAAVPEPAVPEPAVPEPEAPEPEAPESEVAEATPEAEVTSKKSTSKKSKGKKNR
jgi:elongation factor Ts